MNKQDQIDVIKILGNNKYLNTGEGLTNVSSLTTTLFEKRIQNESK